MEAHGNEYVAQLLDRAATLIRDLEPADGATEAQEYEIKRWLSEYQAEKARFGQPLGSPAYAAAHRGDADQDETSSSAEDGAPVDARRSRRLKLTEDQLRAQGEDAPATPRPEDYDGRYDGMNAGELQAEAERRKLAKSGTKAELIDRLHQSDMGTSAG